MPIAIDRCYCFRETFADLKKVAEETGVASVRALQDEVVFGQRCRLCHPYVRRMLRTGETCFGEIVREADEPAGQDDQPEAQPPHGAVSGQRAA